LSSGLGFILCLKDTLTQHSVARFLEADPNLDCSKLLIEWPTGNVIIGLLMPQRAFLLGLTISAWILAGLFYVLLGKEKNKNRAKIILVAVGVLTGLLPITHMHSLISLAVILGPMLFVALIVRKKRLDLLYYIIPASVISITLYLVFIAGGIENPNFIQWLPGWDAIGGLLSWVVMWLKLWGLMLPVAIFGLFTFRQKSLLTKIFFLDFFLLFILGNLILFQPILWDNSKIFFWAYLGFCGLAAAGISWCWEKGGRVFGKIGAVLLAIVLTFTGFIELLRLQKIVQTNPPILMTSRDDIQLATEIRKKTDPLAIFLTESSNSNTNFIMTWSARPVLMGYPAWVENLGFLYKKREQDIKIMYRGGTNAERLLRQYQISYVVIASNPLRQELLAGQDDFFQANEAYYKAHYAVKFQNKNYRIYDVRSLLP